MKHFTASLWKATRAPRQTIDTVIDNFAKITDIRNTASTKAISYTLKPAFVRSFANSGHPFLTFYEFNDLAGWCRDTYFAPEHVGGYNDDIGKSYTVWTHQAVSAYRRHIILDELVENIEVSFEVPSLNCASWFPLRIRLFDRDGLYFQTDQKLVVDRIHDGGSMLTSWKKIPALRESLPRLHQRTTRAILP
jgi:hypothetical protein